MALIDTAFLDSKTYGFEWLRYLLDVAPVQEGVLNAGDFKVTAAAAGGQRVDVAAGTALVRGDTGTRNALYMQVNDASIASAVTLNASDATNPRIDQIILRVRDSNDLGDTSDAPALEAVAGTPTAGATLDNRTGAAALPSNAVRLADVLIPAASTAVAAGNVRDRRPWARGAYHRIIRTANAAGGVDYGGPLGTSGTSLLDATNLAPRIECGGSPLRVSIQTSIQHDTAGEWVYLRPHVDGVAPTDVGTRSHNFISRVGFSHEANSAFDLVITPGSHVIALHGSQPGGGIGKISASASYPLIMAVEELLRPNASNT